jgi:error-prone DNA polymerase
MDKLIAWRINRYERPHELCNAGVTVTTLEQLANAFRSIGLDRRQAFWEVSELKDRPIGVFKRPALGKRFRTPNPITAYAFI